MQYTQEIIVNKNTGNNAFSYDARIAATGNAQLTIPCLQNILSVAEIQLGEHIVFEEIDHHHDIRSCKGLQYIYQMKDSKKFPDIDIIIFDNHNHALYFWMKHLLQDKKHQNIDLIHIDQHSDLSQPVENIDQQQIDNLDYIREYTNYSCNVGNFIKPFLETYPETHFQRIKSEAQLLKSQVSNLKSTSILDIDLDFRAPEMSIEHYTDTITMTQEIMKQASLITIATSPYFLDQQRALEILTDLFSCNIHRLS